METSPKSGFVLHKDGPVCRVDLEGDLTASMAQSMQAELRQLVEQDTREIIFNLARTVILDSSGIGLLIATYNSLSRRQGSVKVIEASPDIMHLLQSIRLVDRLRASGRTAS
jgi:anti-anti-sigma factor